VEPRLDPAVVEKDKKAMGSPRLRVVPRGISPCKSPTRELLTPKERKLKLCADIQKELMQVLQMPDLINKDMETESEFCSKSLGKNKLDLQIFKQLSKFCDHL
jgi:hypothetical protein